jgi:hypothetical protein
MDIRLEYQPINSPDLNVLTLGYFNSIQSLQQTKQLTTVDDLINIVEESYKEIPKVKLNNLFLTLQCCMEEIIIHGGKNNYKITHMNKEKLEQEGRFPIFIVCSQKVIDTINSVEKMYM